MSGVLPQGFAKLDRTITNSSLWTQGDDVLRVWVALLASADAQGYVRASAPAMARTCNVERARYDEIIEYLASPDADSRTPDHDGRRLDMVDGGYQILNHQLYRGGRDPEARREQKRDWWHRNRAKSSTPQDAGTLRDTATRPSLDQTRHDSATLDRVRPHWAQVEVEAEVEAEAEGEAEPTTTGRENPSRILGDPISTDRGYGTSGGARPDVPGYILDIDATPASREEALSAFAADLRHRFELDGVAVERLDRKSVV